MAARGSRRVMSTDLRIAITLGVFVLAIVLVLLRPRGWHEAWWTSLGAAILLALGIVTPHQAVDAVLAGREALVFLLALLLLTALIEQSGFFEWAAIRSAQLARGNGRALYRNVFLLGALITAVLSLDTTAVMLTPIVLAFVQRLKLPARPFVFACAFISNAGSLVLPISNLTNLLYVGTFKQSFATFSMRMFFPQLVTIVLLYTALSWLFRQDLPASYEASRLGDPFSAVRHRGFFHLTSVVLALVFAGYFIGPMFGIPAYVVAFAAAAVLAVAGSVMAGLRLHWLRDVPFGLFPFVAGLFILVYGVETLGLTAPAVQWFRSLGGHLWSEVFAGMGMAAIASNVINNLPAALLVRGLLEDAHSSVPAAYGALLGTNIGPNITLFGSLATMLVVAGARRKGVEISAGQLFRVGVVVTPILLVAAAVVLALTFIAFPS